MGTTEEQQLERLGQLDFINITVRFFSEVMAFIYEGEKRHPSQKVYEGPKAQDGKLLYVDYNVKLPPRSLNEFSRWVYRFMDSAQFIKPSEMAEKYKQAAQNLLVRYL